MLRLHVIFDIPQDRIRPDLALFLKRMLRPYNFKCVEYYVENQKSEPKPIMAKPGETLRMMG